jgi:hypothetical protein
MQSKPRFKSIHRPGEARELFFALVIREHPRDPRFELRILGSWHLNISPRRGMVMKRDLFLSCFLCALCVLCGKIQLRF